MAFNRDLMVVVGGRLVSTLLALVSIRAVTTFLSPEQYGELILLMTVLTFCGLFLINPVGQHINLHTHAWWDDGTLLSRLKSYRIYIFTVAFVGFLSVFVLNKQGDIYHLLMVALTMLAMVVANTWNATLIPMLNQLGFRSASTVLGLVTAVAALAASLILTLWLPSAPMWFLGQFFGMALGAAAASRILRKHAVREEGVKNTLPLLNKNVLLNYCLPLALATGLMWLQTNGYRLLIDGYWGLKQLGFLAVGLQLSAQVLSVAEALAMQFLYPYFFRRVTNHENREEVALAYSDLLNTLIPVYVLLAGLLTLAAPYLLKILVAEQYQNAVGLVCLGAVIETCRMLGNVLSNAAHVRRQTKYLSLPYAVGAVVALGAIAVAGHFQLAIEWAAYGLLGAGGGMLLTMACMMYRQIQFNLDYQRNMVASVLMLLMFAMQSSMPAQTGIGLSLAMLLLIGVLGGAVIFALLRQNPATLRLLEVQLRSH